MVQIGKIVKYDDYGRITCPSVLADLLDLDKGQDEVSWNIEDGKVVVKKITKIYGGNFDFESEEIEQKLRAYEESRAGCPPEEEMDYEEAKSRARAQYQKDKENRNALKLRK